LFFGVLTERHWFWVFFFMKNQTRKEKVTYDSNVLKSNWDIYIYIYRCCFLNYFFCLKIYKNNIFNF
jgi:hypothetical protein